MRIEPGSIEGVFIITPEVHRDERGFFMETYRDDLLREKGITDVFVQDNHSLSTHKNTVRGLHFQWDKPMAKIMRVTRGRAFLVAVDLRRSSPTLGQWFGIDASAENKIQLYAPGSFARGFQTLTEDVEVQYKCSAIYNPEAQGEIAWNDADIHIDWPLKEVPFISANARQSPSFADWLTRAESATF
jgi:dTDP-4-dehydrorhamnose 3,5-epimerase